MRDPLQAVKVVSWQSIIVGTFMAVKIPETIILLFVMSQADPTFANSFFPGASLFSFAGAFLWLSVSILSVSLLLIIAGYFLLQKKSWARNILEVLCWLLLTFVFVNIAQALWHIFAGLKSLSATSSIYSLSLIPFLFLGGILLFDLVLLRNKKVKRVLS